MMYISLCSWLILLCIACAQFGTAVGELFLFLIKYILSENYFLSIEHYFNIIIYLILLYKYMCKRELATILIEYYKLSIRVFKF